MERAKTKSCKYGLAVVNRLVRIQHAGNLKLIDEHVTRLSSFVYMYYRPIS